MKESEYNEHLESRCTQLRLLKQTLRSLHEEKDLAESIRESTLRAAETANRPEEKEHIRKRFPLSLSFIRSGEESRRMEGAGSREGNGN